MSAGMRSGRIDSSCPNFTKMGPSSCSASRSRTARGRDRSAQKKATRNGRRTSAVPRPTMNSSSPWRPIVERIRRRRKTRMEPRFYPGPCTVAPAKAPIVTPAKAPIVTPAKAPIVTPAKAGAQRGFPPARE